MKHILALALMMTIGCQVAEPARNVSHYQSLPKVVPSELQDPETVRLLHCLNAQAGVSVETCKKRMATEDFNRNDDGTHYPDGTLTPKGHQQVYEAEKKKSDALLAEAKQECESAQGAWQSGTCKPLDPPTIGNTDYSVASCKSDVAERKLHWSDYQKYRACQMFEIAHEVCANVILHGDDGHTYYQRRCWNQQYRNLPSECLGDGKYGNSYNSPYTSKAVEIIRNDNCKDISGWNVNDRETHPDMPPTYTMYKNGKTYSCKGHAGVPNQIEDCTEVAAE